MTVKKKKKKRKKEKKVRVNKRRPATPPFEYYSRSRHEQQIPRASGFIDCVNLWEKREIIDAAAKSDLHRFLCTPHRVVALSIITLSVFFWIPAPKNKVLAKTLNELLNTYRFSIVKAYLSVSLLRLFRATNNLIERLFAWFNSRRDCFKPINIEWSSVQTIVHVELGKRKSIDRNWMGWLWLSRRHIE